MQTFAKWYKRLRFRQCICSALMSFLTDSLRFATIFGKSNLSFYNSDPVMSLSGSNCLL